MNAPQHATWRAPSAPAKPAAACLRWACTAACTATRTATRTATCAATCAALLLSPAIADPMRPLATALPAAALAASGAALAADAAASSPPSGVAAGAPARGLLAIRSDSLGQRLALFGDRWLRVGDRFAAADGETTVLAIGPNQVELVQGKLRHTHYLLPPLLPGQWAARTGTAPAHSKPDPKSEIPASMPALAGTRPVAPAVHALTPVTRPAR